MERPRRYCTNRRRLDDRVFHGLPALAGLAELALTEESHLRRQGRPEITLQRRRVTRRMHSSAGHRDGGIEECALLMAELNEAGGVNLSAPRQTVKRHFKEKGCPQAR